MYILRLDDASEFMSLDKWDRMEKLLDKYGIKPIYGIIPANKDPNLLSYGKVENFWQLMTRWEKKGWAPALHGFTHVFETNEGGINPVNFRSEYAGVKLEHQKYKIREGYKILKEHNIEPAIFFAPAHTFDKNTMVALKEESPIRIISDTIANDIYFRDNFYFIPQQSGQCRKLPFKTVTFCYHPNIMSDDDFQTLENFLRRYAKLFCDINAIKLKKRNRGIADVLLEKIYFFRRK